MQAAELLKTDFDATVTLKFPDGTKRSASARALLKAAGTGAKTWLAGPVATEWLLVGSLVDARGQPDPDLRVQFHVRAYAGCKAVRVSVVVENCLDTWAGNIGYDAAVALGKQGPVVYEKKDVNHRRLSRWRKDFWWPAAPPQVNVAHDLAYLSASGALPNYDRSLTIPEKTLAEMAARWAKSSETDILGSGSLTKYMPTTGGREEIGPYPNWTVAVSVEHGPAGEGDRAGQRRPGRLLADPRPQRATGRILTLDQRPKFWLNGYRVEDRERPLVAAGPQSPAAAANGRRQGGSLLSQPGRGPHGLAGLRAVPGHAAISTTWRRRISGRNYTLLAQWPVPRQDGRGIMSDQIRGDAWGLRNIADAGFIAPDGDPEGKYFETRIHNNMAEMTARMYGPPEYNKLGFWGARTVEDARIGDAANPRWMITAPWEHDYLIWSLHHLTELGYADAAKPRDFELRWQVGALPAPPRVRSAAGSALPDGRRRDGARQEDRSSMRTGRNWARRMPGSTGVPRRRNPGWPTTTRPTWPWSAAWTPGSPRLPRRSRCYWI